MVTKGVLCLATLVSLALSAACPSYTCDSTLASNVCASWTSGQNFKLNSNGCQSGYYCSEIATDLWAQLKTSLGGDNTLTCLASGTSSGTTTSGTWTNMPCMTKQANKTFKTGATVVNCNSDNECLLADGGKTTCDCAFRSDGAGICTPDKSNDVVFTGYWTDCGTDNLIDDADNYAYWSYYFTMWVYQQSNVACTSIFLEQQLYDDLYSAYNGSAVLVFGLAALLY